MYKEITDNPESIGSEGGANRNILLVAFPEFPEGFRAILRALDKKRSSVLYLIIFQLSKKIHLEGIGREFGWTERRITELSNSLNDPDFWQELELIHARSRVRKSS